MYEVGDLVICGGTLGMFTGRERTKEKFDAFGIGGLFVGQIQIVALRCSQSDIPIGRKLWVDRKRARKPNTPK